MNRPADRDGIAEDKAKVRLGLNSIAAPPSPSRTWIEQVALPVSAGSCSTTKVPYSGLRVLADVSSSIIHRSGTRVDVE